MARKPRFNLVGVPQHVIQRGNNREPCFFSELDYSRYLDDLQQAKDKYNCRIHAYVLMTNHVHMLVTPMEEYAVSNMMQALGRRYVIYVNRTYQRTGTLWEGRYKASLVDSEQYLLTCMRYIEQNPVRAQMVEHPAEYPWSSYHANAQQAENLLLDRHPVYERLGDSTESMAHAYRDLFKTHLDDDTIDDIRSALNHEMVLGASYFKNMIEEVTKRQVRPGLPGRPSIKEDEGEYWLGY